MPATPASRFAQIDEKLSANTGCGLCRFLASLPAEDAAYINWMLGQPTKGHVHIAKVIEDGDGPLFDPKVISRHRERHLER